MKKRNYIALAMLGVTCALASCNKASGDEMDPEMKKFYEELTPDAQAKFKQLDENHRRMALKINEMVCSGTSQCKGHREQAVERQYKHQMEEKRKQASDQMKG